MWNAWQTACDNAATAAAALREKATATAETLAVRGAPMMENLLERAIPVAQQARQQAANVGETLARAAGPKASSQVRGLFVGAFVKERALMRRRETGQQAAANHWTDVMLIVDGGLLNVYNGWEATEGDVPDTTINLAELATVVPEPNQDGEPHCFRVTTQQSPEAPAQHTVFQANTDEECGAWVGLLQGVANALTLRSKAGQALQATSTAVKSHLPASVAATTAPTTLSAQARGFFTAAKHEGLLQVPGRLLGQPAQPPLKGGAALDDADMLAELEADSGTPANPTGEAATEAPDARERFLDAWAVLAEGQLKLYKDEEEFKLMGTAETVVDMANVSSVVEHGELFFELTGNPPESTASNPNAGQYGADLTPTASYMFKALVPEDRATWVGLLRGVEQSLLAKHRLLDGKAAVEEKLSEAATALFTKYQAYTQSTPSS
eukprot:GGOE01061992.1.p1 GENE.GGOE01061992.1~~GGOE01061992.1.p1  ORF type:complete len:461 (+),score=147.97 GGOE01061992.1:68-1384(+)